MKKMCLHDISIYTNFHQNQSMNERTRIFLHESGLILPWMTFEVILHLIKKLRLHKVDILEKI